MNNTTRKFPRSMVEAFGPYADRTPLEPMREKHRKADAIVITGSLLAAIALVVILAMERFA